MAHFAELDENNIVVNVTVVNNSDLLDINGNESEEIGVQYLTSLFGPKKWKQTSYNSSFRFRYAGLGMIYDEEHDAFTFPKQFPSFIWNASEGLYVPPIPRPDEPGSVYEWDEENQTWIYVGVDENYQS